MPSKSSLRPDQIKKLVWELAPTHPDLPPDEYRCIDQRWVIRWSRFELAKPGGWWIEGERIIVWEDKKLQLIIGFDEIHSLASLWTHCLALQSMPNEIRH